MMALLAGYWQSDSVQSAITGSGDDVLGLDSLAHLVVLLLRC